LRNPDAHVHIVTVPFDEAMAYAALRKAEASAGR
jgi:hypothetical protein